VRPFRRVDYHTEHYLVVAEVGERLAVSNKQHRSLMWGGFNMRKLCELLVRIQYQIKFSKRFAALENFIDIEGINRA